MLPGRRVGESASEPGCRVTRGLVFAGGAFCAEEAPGKASKAAVAIITMQNCNVLLDRSPMWMLLPGNICRGCKSLPPARYFFSKLLVMRPPGRQAADSLPPVVKS